MCSALFSRSIDGENKVVEILWVAAIKVLVID